MKGLLRSVMALGLLAGVGLGVGCRSEGGNQSEDAMKSPIQEKYQPPSADEARTPGGPTQVHPSTGQGQGTEQPPQGNVR